MASSALVGASAVGFGTIGGARSTTLCNPATWKLGAESRSRARLNDGTPQTKTSTLRRIHGTQAALTPLVPIGARNSSSARPCPSARGNGVPRSTGRGVALSSSSHFSLGCQTLSNQAVAAIAETEAATSTNHGPWKLAIKNCGIAKAKPAVSAAGHTPSIPRNPAIAQTTQKGIISEKNGSWRPTI